MARANFAVGIRLAFWVRPFVMVCVWAAFLLRLDVERLAWLPGFVATHGVKTKPLKASQ